ncbi:MAG: universal stress protein [Reyranellaceae bacterium]
MTLASLMVRLVPGGANDALLALAVDLALRLKVTEAIGVAACQPLQVLGSPEAYVPQDLLDRDRAQTERDLEACRQSFNAAFEGKVTTVEWRSAVTFDSLSDWVAQQMRAADLLVTPADEGTGSLFDASRRVGVADLVLKTGRPLLIVGRDVARLDLSSVVVAWKDGREARRAVEDSLPLLRLAERVTVLEIAAAGEVEAARNRVEDVADWLARHGIAASGQAVASVGDDATQLSSLAAELGAGLLVGGAYGHARLREWILGGVTEDLLLRPVRCSLVSH